MMVLKVALEQGVVGDGHLHYNNQDTWDVEHHSMHMAFVFQCICILYNAVTTVLPAN